MCPCEVIYGRPGEERVIPVKIGDTVEGEVGRFHISILSKANGASAQHTWLNLSEPDRPFIPSFLYIVCSKFGWDKKIITLSNTFVNSLGRGIARWASVMQSSLPDGVTIDVDAISEINGKEFTVSHCHNPRVRIT